MSESKYPTIGGKVTRAEAFAKMMHHLREAQDMAAVVGHLYLSEGDKLSEAMGKSWILISELIKRVIDQIIVMAKGQFN